jgi:hypothetical protein
MRKHNLKLQPDKCEFLRKEVAYLGHVIIKDGSKPDERKIEAVKNFPVPTRTRMLKSSFLPNFSRIAKPLTELLKRNASYVWDDKTKKSFNTLKE